MMKTMCLLVCSVIKLDNSGDDRFLPRSSSKITKSSELRREKIRSDSSWRALSPSKLECGRIIISAAEGARRRSKKTKNAWLNPGFVLFSDCYNGDLHNVYGGERGIRTLDELPHTAFRERPVQPLLHLSVSN